MFKAVLSKSAVEQYLKLPSSHAARINKAIDILSENPHHHQNIKKLKGELDGFYRYRSGVYRIVYSVNNQAGTIEIVWIGQRNKAYK
jgi:mRNA interferase RelE/StbE